MANETEQVVKKGNNGGMWRKKTSQDKIFFSGNIEIPDEEGNPVKYFFNAFQNDYAKENPAQPAYRIFLSEPRDNTEAPATPKAKPVAAKPAAVKTVKKVVKAPVVEVEEEEEQVETTEDEILLD